MVHLYSLWMVGASTFWCNQVTRQWRRSKDAVGRCCQSRCLQHCYTKKKKKTWCQHYRQLLSNRWPSSLGWDGCNKIALWVLVYLRVFWTFSLGSVTQHQDEQVMPTLLKLPCGPGSTNHKWCSLFLMGVGSLSCLPSFLWEIWEGIFEQLFFCPAVMFSWGSIGFNLFCLLFDGLWCFEDGDGTQRYSLSLHNAASVAKCFNQCLIDSRGVNVLDNDIGPLCRNAFIFLSGLLSSSLEADSFIWIQISSLFHLSSNRHSN